MKKLTLTILCFTLLSAATLASAQSNDARQNRGYIERLLNGTTSEQSSAPKKATSTPQATSTPAPTPAPTTPVDPTPAPTKEEEPEPIPVPAPIIDEPTTPTTPTEDAPTTSSSPTTGASADPDVLAAQNSSPTAGAGNVYRGNTLPADMTQFLLLAALSFGVLGVMLAEHGVFGRMVRVLIPQPLTRSRA